MFTLVTLGPNTATSLVVSLILLKMLSVALLRCWPQLVRHMAQTYGYIAFKCIRFSHLFSCPDLSHFNFQRALHEAGRAHWHGEWDRMGGWHKWHRYLLSELKHPVSPVPVLSTSLLSSPSISLLCLYFLSVCILMNYPEYLPLQMLPHTCKHRDIHLQ